MVGRLFLLFTVVTLVEMFLLVKLAMWMSFGWTLLLVIATGFAGAWLARREGVRVLVEVRTQMAQGRVPALPLVEGLCILLAGALLMTPGVLTDIVGFALVLPAPRRVLAAYWLVRMQGWIANHTVSVQRVTLDPHFGPMPGGPMPGFAPPPAGFRVPGGVEDGGVHIAHPLQDR
jgi:UPF0716 protein FxsA